MSVDPAYLERLVELTWHVRLMWAVAAIVLILFFAFSVRCGARFRVMRVAEGTHLLARIHSDRGATASMEYLLVLVPFLVIVMTIWQLAFMTNAQLHIGYATYAVARSASVMIPADMDGEEAGKLNKFSASKESKWTRILQAARPGTIAISPGDLEVAGGVFGMHQGAKLLTGGGFNGPQTPDALGTFSRITLMSMHMCGTPVFCSPRALEGTRALRSAVKDYYAQNMTIVKIDNADHTTSRDIGDKEIIKVRVEYIFWLQVPWVGRVIEALNKNRADAEGKPLFYNPYPSMTLAEETTINVWIKRRATEPCT